MLFAAFLVRFSSIRAFMMKLYPFSPEKYSSPETPCRASGVRSGGRSRTGRAFAMLLPAVVLLSVAACSTGNKVSRSVADIVTPYRADVVQGNFISSEQVQALREGMTRRQVAEVLGTPLLASVFHSDRWDYVFTIRRQGVQEKKLRLTAFFENNVLARTEGDEMPSELEFVASIDAKKPQGKANSLLASPEAIEQHLKKLAEKKQQEEVGVSGVIAPPATDYPPLEP